MIGEWESTVIATFQLPTPAPATIRKRITPGFARQELLCYFYLQRPKGALYQSSGRLLYWVAASSDSLLVESLSIHHQVLDYYSIDASFPSLVDNLFEVGGTKIMSADDHAASDITTVCASCGVAEIDEIQLKECDNCDLVRYCSDECQGDHKSEHEEECKKRAAELRDERLFKQPKCSHHGDCPLCCLPLPLVMNKSSIYDCCSKRVCDGCGHANQIREREMRLEYSCPFCRKTLPKTKEESVKLAMKRVKANNPLAMCQEGVKQYSKGEYSKAFEYWTKAAELGDLEAHYKLAALYQLGHGPEKNTGKEIFHFEEAAIGGHPSARYVLGWHENKNGSKDRAVKHWIISATQGYDESIKALMDTFKEGFVEKDVLAVALRAHQAAVDAMKSPEREAAERYFASRNFCSFNEQYQN